MRKSENKTTKEPVKFEYEVITPKGLNIREKASFNAEKIGLLKQGTIVTGAAARGGWVKLTDGGYIKSEFVKKTYYGYS